MIAIRFFDREEAPLRSHLWHLGLFALIAAVTVALDQLTKYLVVTFMELGDTVPLWDGVFHITRVTPNPGAAFGIFSAPEHRWIFMTVSTVALIAIAVYLALDRTVPLFGGVAMAFIFGGGVGTMIDRTLEGAVVDFLDFRLINFAVFNVADSFVCIGVGMVVLLLILTWVGEFKKQKKGKDA